MSPRQVDQPKEPLTMRPPWTPLPRRLGAYSARSTDRSHSITLWLDHCTTSDGERSLCEREEESGEVRPTGPTRVLCGASPCESAGPERLAEDNPYAYRPRPPGQLPESPPSFQEIKLSLNLHFHTEISDSRIPLLPDSGYFGTNT